MDTANHVDATNTMTQQPNQDTLLLNREQMKITRAAGLIDDNGCIRPHPRMPFYIIGAKTQIIEMIPGAKVHIREG